MACCYIALGSNLNKPLAQVEQAIQALKQMPDSQLVATSPWYQSKAIGPGEQSDYINGVACLNTSKAPLDLLHCLQRIEHNQQRQRQQRWGPRTLDLDLLLYANQIIDEPTLSVPHPRMKERSFVLYPLFDIAPQLHFPDGSSLYSLLHYCSSDGINRLDDTLSNKVM